MSPPRMLVACCLSLTALLALSPARAAEPEAPAEGRAQATTRTAAEAIEQEAPSSRLPRDATPPGGSAGTAARSGPAPGQTGLGTTGTPGQDAKGARPAGGKTIYGEIIVHK